MKIRVRSLDSESRETVRIEIADDSSFRHLKHSIAQAIQYPCPSSLRLYLSRTHEISPPSPEDSLLSLPIASGDLLFYSVLADGASTSTSRSDPADAALDEQAMETTEEKFDWCFPESCFVRRLIRALSDNFGEEDLEHKLMISAVHSAFLESGFVLAFDEKLRFPSCMAFGMCVRYTLPEIISASKKGVVELESVVVKFKIMNNFLKVYGHLTKPGSGSTFHMCLDASRFAPVIYSLRSATTGATREDLEGELFHLWKMVSDGLAFPLKVDLCAQAGLAGPACLARLPADLLLSIVDLLPGKDVARAGCACRDLAYLARDDGLWRRKFEEEFGEAAPVSEPAKDAYVKRWRRWREFWATLTREHPAVAELLSGPVKTTPIYVGPWPAPPFNDGLPFPPQLAPLVHEGPPYPPALAAVLNAGPPYPWDLPH